MKQILIALVLFTLLNMHSFGQDKKKKIVFVDLTEVMLKYKKRIDFETDLKKSQEEIKKKIDDQKKRLTQIAKDIKAAESEEEKDQSKLEFLKFDKQLKFFVEFNKDKMTMLYNMQYVELVRDIKRSIHDYGMIKKYFLILQTHPPKPKNEEARKTMMQLSVADVLYYDTEYDISDEIVRTLNSSYLHKKAEAEKANAEKKKEK